MFWLELVSLPGVVPGRVLESLKLQIGIELNGENDCPRIDWQRIDLP